jgi:tRNA threonylcarbamoyladenosine dehydratase
MAEADIRFSGIARLYGVVALEKFQKARVLVVGVGGVGSWVVEALARSGVGSLTLVDLDEICLTNVNRQLHAMDGQIGRQKIAAMAERVRAINPAAEVEEISTFYSEKNSAEILDRGFDVVIDSIDLIRQKCLLIAECKSRGIPVITCGGAGGRCDPLQIQVGDLARTIQDALMLQVRKYLRTHYGFPKAGDRKRVKKFGVTAVYSIEKAVFPKNGGGVSCEKNGDGSMRLNCDSGYGTCSAVTAAFAMVMTSQVLKILIDKNDR